MRPLTPAPRYSVHDKQLEVLESEARYKVLEWGRRAGKNICSVVDKMEFARAPWEYKWGTDDPATGLTWWVGASYDQARKYGFDKMLAALPDSWIEGDPKYTAPYEINLINGWTFEFRTYDKPKTLQGAGVDDLLIDEADYMPNGLWYDDLEPMLMDTGGRASFISKPVRPRSYFRTLAERGKSSDWPDHYYSHATSADNPFIFDDPMDKRGTMPEHKFKQQYLAILPDDGNQVFKHLSERVVTGDWQMKGMVNEGIGEAWRPIAQCTPPFTVGVDFARHRDYRVSTALDAAGELAYYSRARNEDWDTIFDDVVKLHADYPGVVVPDASRDNKIIPDLANAGVTMVPKAFSPKMKKSLIEDLITRIESGDITLPDDESIDQIILELRAMERQVTPAGYTRYHAPDDGHDDCVDSLALASSELDRIRQTARKRQLQESNGQEADTGVSAI